MRLNTIFFSFLILFPLVYGQIDCDLLDIESSCPSQYSCLDQICVHNPIFPLTISKIIEALIIMIICGLASAAGIGGGIMLSPVLLIFSDYVPDQAISIVYILIFGGSLGAIGNVIRLRDNELGGPMINYDFVLICLPLMLMATQMGVILNRILPNIIPLIGTILLVLVVFKKTFIKAKKEFATEKKRSSKQENQETAAEILEIIPNSVKEKSKNEIAPNYMNEELEEIKEQEIEIKNNQYPWIKIKEIFFLLILLVTLNLLRGSKNFTSLIGIEYCSLYYWLMCGSIIIFCPIFLIRNILICQKLEKIKEKLKSDNQQNFSMDSKRIVELGSISTLTGILAGMLGIGGGMILGPYFSQIGLSPQRSTATSCVFVLSTSFISSLQTLILNILTIDQICWYFGISVVGSSIISKIMLYVIKRYKRPSIILFALCTVMVIALILVPVYIYLKLSSNNSELFEFYPIC